MPEVVAILLAAGGGTRFAGPEHKLLATLGPPDDTDASRVTVVERSLAAVVDAAVGPIVVVTGAVDLPPRITDEARRTDVELDVVHNDRWDDGQMSSVRLGLETARRRGADIAAIGLADQPSIDPAAWRAVTRAAETAPIAVATYDGTRGNPVALRSDVWDLLPEGGDEGARGLMRLRPDLVIEVPCPGSPADIDTVEDLRRWQNN